MRIVKEHDVRKTELLDAAERLFITKGFQITTIDDIRAELGVAKGTFYHYFKSKDDILDAIIGRIVQEDLIRAREIAGDATLNPAQKFFRVLAAQRTDASGSKAAITNAAHKPENAKLHMRSITSAVKSLAPMIGDIIRQGVRAGEFCTDNPDEVAAILLISGQMLFDEALFNWPEDGKARLMTAFIDSMERLLGAQKGSFDFMAGVLEGEGGEYGIE